jgi:hypothetical protein
VPGSFGHLTHRFFDYLSAGALEAHEISLVRELLPPEEAELFFDQSERDQSHGFAAGRHVMESGAGADVIRAALLHDIGKRHASLGVIGRVLASLLIKAKVPMRGRLAHYRDHGPIAARELDSIGSPALVVAFARHHHARRPQEIEPDTWDLLLEADVPQKASLVERRR